MDVSGPRNAAQRKADALDKLAARHADAWVASASTSGMAHLVPLSFAWDGERMIVATPPGAVTARNILSTLVARVALGGTRDVVMVDVDFDHAIDVDEAPSELADLYARQSDWDPRVAGGAFTFLLLRPRRIQVWREEDEIAGRTIMRDGRWLI